MLSPIVRARLQQLTNTIDEAFGLNKLLRREEAIPDRMIVVTGFHRAGPSLTSPTQGLSIANKTLRSGIELSAHTSHIEKSVSTTQAKLTAASSEATAQSCLECSGTGIVRVWSEFAFFEDLRPCARCDAGNRVEAVIAEIVKRATP